MLNIVQHQKSKSDSFFFKGIADMKLYFNSIQSWYAVFKVFKFQTAIIFKLFKLQTTDNLVSFCPFDITEELKVIHGHL